MEVSKSTAEIVRKRPDVASRRCLLSGQALVDVLSGLSVSSHPVRSTFHPREVALAQLHGDHAAQQPEGQHCSQNQHRALIDDHGA